MPVVEGAAPVAPGTVTTEDLVEETLGHLLAGHREERNELAVSMGSGQVPTIGLVHQLRGLKPGALIEIDFELLYVVETNEALMTATVVRSQGGSKASAHAAGATVRVNPKFPRHRVLRALNDDLADLSSPAHGLFRVRTADVAYNAAVRGFELAALPDLLEVVEVRYQYFGSMTGWKELADWRRSDLALLTPNVPVESTLRVKYRAPFGRLVPLLDTDVTAATGLPATAVDLPPLGAALRMMAGRAVKQTFPESQGEPRRAGEVSTQDTLISTRGLQATRESRILAEATRLARLHPRRVR